MPSPLPRWDRNPSRSVQGCNIGLPRTFVGSAPTSFVFGACSAFTRVTACLLAELPKATLSIEGFGSFVASTVAPITTGRSDSLPGGNCTH